MLNSLIHSKNFAIDSMGFSFFIYIVMSSTNRDSFFFPQSSWLLFLLHVLLHWLRLLVQYWTKLWEWISLPYFFFRSKTLLQLIMMLAINRVANSLSIWVSFLVFLVCWELPFSALLSPWFLPYFSILRCSFSWFLWPENGMLSEF